MGFGLSTPEHIAQVGALADGAVVGSALIDVITDAPGREAAAAGAYLRSLRGAGRRCRVRQWFPSCGRKQAR